MDVSGIEKPLPGYRDTRVYYRQLRSVLEGKKTPEEAAEYLPEDPLVRQSTEQHFFLHLPPDECRRRKEDPELQRFLSLVLKEEEFGLTLLREMEAGKIRRLAIHGDTKLDNFLFSARSGKVKALVDLDTIMPHSWLADWGDMVRSLVNVAGEKETDLRKVRVDTEVFGAVARGFLRTARRVTRREVELMVDAVEIIALELGIRFLSDYLRGDSYFKLGPADPPDLNRTRAMVQLTLFERLRESDAALRRCIDTLRKETAQRR
jgi:N-acetylhexosamine 1-kinase